MYIQGDSSLSAVNMSLINICRICLDNSVELRNIFEERVNNRSLSALLSEFAVVEVSQGDGLPSTICGACNEKLMTALDLRQQIIKSDKQLRTEVIVKSEIKIEDGDNLEIVTVDVPAIPVETEEVKVKAKRLRYYCAECDKCFSRRAYFIAHNRKHTGEVGDATPNVCDICNKRFALPWLLKLHTRIHTGVKPCVCKTCGRTFRFPSALTIHKRIHTGEKPYKCTVCDKSFTQSGGLQAHLPVHTGERAFMCEICSVTFTSFTTLRKHHLGKHKAGKGKYGCPTCEKRFNTSTILKNHLKTHTGEKPFSCSVCTKRFTERGSLKLHMRIHEGVKPYSCKICGKRFTQSSCLVRHMRVHSGERPYPCTACPERFMYSHHLLKHMKIRHQQESSPTVAT
ncbi:gastrula zinc finger protein XlCGF52.1-like [Photinus pyralis]|nr:gastrula zinc finger protein XlCGF52.1-like [Photinus pyralis]